jgi:hypothetical protein
LSGEKNSPSSVAYIAGKLYVGTVPYVPQWDRRGLYTSFLPSFLPSSESRGVRLTGTYERFLAVGGWVDEAVPGDSMNMIEVVSVDMTRCRHNGLNASPTTRELKKEAVELEFWLECAD